MQQRQYVTIRLVDASGRITGLIHLPIHSRFHGSEARNAGRKDGRERCSERYWD
ncbi:histidine kinase [Azorhizophilus paspali]|uniref:Histidine kinase n=1 Tax=Azorhizophilus paspali TaxID=69963 RepID=A0ABV6SKA4_AZOPA